MEIRIDYESGNTGEAYWSVGPQENDWRAARAAPELVAARVLPTSTATPVEPAIDVLSALLRANKAAGARRSASLPPALSRALSQIYVQPDKPLPPSVTNERILKLASLLVPPSVRTAEVVDAEKPQSRAAGAAAAGRDLRRAWGLLATHVPGLTGHQCYQRWVSLTAEKPLEKRSLLGRQVMVPRREWPSEQCNGNGGEGWRARVTKVCGSVVKVVCEGERKAFAFPMKTVLGWRPVG